MAMAHLFRALTTPISALDFKDKVKITIKSNAGVKCLTVPNPCEIMSFQPSKETKSCDVLKISLSNPTTGFTGDIAYANPYLKIEETEDQNPNHKKEAFSCTGKSSTTHGVSAHIKKEPRSSGAFGGAHNVEDRSGEETGPEIVKMKKEECHLRAKDDFSDTQDISVHIKEEELIDDLKRQPGAEGKVQSVYIKEESDTEEEPSSIDESQIVMVKIKEEPTSSEEDSDPGDVLNIREGPSTSKLSAQRKERILPRTLPLVIRDPRLTQGKMALPKETKTGLLKKLMELGAPDNAQEMRTLTCTPMKMYKCSKCPRYFTSKARLKRHYLAHKKYKVSCPDCGRRFACKATVLRHQVVHSKEKPFPCSFCEKSFSTDKGREIHERRHTGDKPFICSECGKNFLFKAQLKSHQMIHSGERYSCHECGRCYRTKPGLVLHMRIHNGHVPYFCPECGKGFVQKSNLKNHLHTHSQDKPFTCLQCGKSFRQKYNLKQHMSVHVAKECREYSCSECGKSYKRRADYRWHMLIHLGER